MTTEQKTAKNIIEGVYMKKKKLIYFISTCLLTLIISGGLYYYNVYNSIKVIDIHANYVTYDTEEDYNKLTPDSLDNSKHIDIKKDVIEKYREICK
ncbi:hypothetical protein SAMN04489757_12647 [Anaerocolumna aminovalerica]|uniref:Uncharacterized protein n=2 Tax=Anaerocolumna aminovalerica TaxID=1527 RepID=A0A1I5H7S7_9FIRM|nr:hypothetical protein SAMN04489757_12647 [Anaerocolumna aminovalerica]